MSLPIKEADIKDIKSFVHRWNINYPIDHWWRKKHSIAFNSEEHRVVSFLDQLVEYIEDKEYDRAYEDYKKDSEYTTGNWLIKRESEISNEKLIEEWNKLNL